MGLVTLRNEFRPGIIFGKISDGFRTLYVVTERTGGGFDLQVELKGIFSSLEGFKQVIQKNGVVAEEGNKILYFPSLVNCT